MRLWMIAALVGSLGLASPAMAYIPEGEAASAPSCIATLQVRDMTCENCAQEIVPGMKRLAGVTSALLDFAQKTVTIEYDPAQVTPKIMIAELQKLGYSAALVSPK